MSAGIPDEVLDSTWKDTDLARLAQHIVSWEEYAPFWGLTEAEEEEIKKDNPTQYAVQKLAALRRWKAKNPETATYRQLVRVFARMGKIELAEKVREIVLTPEEVPTGGPVGVLSSYREFLEKDYVQLPHPGMLTSQWPIMNSPVYVQLPLSKQQGSQCMPVELLQTGFASFFHLLRGPLFQHGNDRSGKSEEQAVHLPQLLSECSGRSIAITGLPGCGKTTLTWHATQQWAKRELFQQFSLFLSVPLRSSRVQQATCLADLIPHPDGEHRKAIAQAISTTTGDSVCLWFDGWDEMPQNLQKESFVASFIRRDSPGSSLPGCTTVVTTRPEALYLKSSEKIWINGPSVDQVNEIIVRSLEGTAHNPSELITSLEKNTSLQAFCLTVPINIAILVSVFFLFHSGLPNTQTELFKCLVLNLLLYNLQSRWKLGITSLKSFAALPDSPAQSFRLICELAFDGVMNSKMAFSRSDVPSLQKQQSLSLSTLGLMKIVPQMEWYGIEEELTFLHTTLQEFLAAVHLTTWENKEQVRIVKNLVKSESWYQQSVLQFYVGLMGLGNRKVFAAILRGCCVTLDDPVGRYQSCRWGLTERVSSFLTFVNCIFEAQSGQLCYKLAQQDHNFPSEEFDMCLAFDYACFNTTDFSRLGYFIGWFCQQKTCELVFQRCYITPKQLKVFINQVKQVWNNELHRPSLSLAEFQCERVYPLCGLIKDTSLVSKFNIGLSFNSVDSLAFTHYYAALKSIVEAFTRNTSCKCLILRYDLMLLLASKLRDTCIRYSEYYAVLLITFSKYLEKITFSGFFQRYYDYPLFACALQYNTNLQHLDLSKNYVIYEKAIANIARALSFNKSVKSVNLGDWLSNRNLTVFLVHYGYHVCGTLPIKSSLQRVFVGDGATPGEREKQIIRKINCTRGLSGDLFQVIKYTEANARCTHFHYVVYDGFHVYNYNPANKPDNDEERDLYQESEASSNESEPEHLA